ncbi:MAG: helix-turn-helix domain-containing protein [Solirubrobacterales bacterium]
MAKRDSAEALLDALEHPLRRDLLRRLVQSEDKMGSRELARIEEQPLSRVSYHLARLDELDAVETAGDLQIGFSFSQFYRPTSWVRESVEVLSALGLEG